MERVLLVLGWRRALCDLPLGLLVVPIDLVYHCGRGVAHRVDVVHRVLRLGDCEQLEQLHGLFAEGPFRAAQDRDEDLVRAHAPLARAGEGLEDLVHEGAPIRAHHASELPLEVVAVHLRRLPASHRVDVGGLRQAQRHWEGQVLDVDGLGDARKPTRHLPHDALVDLRADAADPRGHDAVHPDERGALAVLRGEQRADALEHLAKNGGFELQVLCELVQGGVLHPELGQELLPQCGRPGVIRGVRADADGLADVHGHGLSGGEVRLVCHLDQLGGVVEAFHAIQEHRLRLRRRLAIHQLGLALPQDGERDVQEAGPRLGLLRPVRPLRRVREEKVPETEARLRRQVSGVQAHEGTVKDHGQMETERAQLHPQVVLVPRNDAIEAVAIIHRAAVLDERMVH
mmetsp:Transcript_103030/g.315204  ORF Transcript_103030/g.315204 Transcript_103030/m.315204 type:complete len:401 (-) Transcript_103030:2128-3330(-)